MTAAMKVFHDHKAVNGPAKITPSQAPKSEAASGKDDKALGRVAKRSRKNSSSFEVAFINNNEFYSATGQADYGAGESVVSSKVAEHAVLRGIGEMTKRDLFTLQVALKDSTVAEKFR